MIKERIKCISNSMNYIDRDGKNVEWTPGEEYWLTIDIDNNTLEIEYDQGITKSCIVGFPSIVLMEVFSYDLFKIKEQARELQEKLGRDYECKY